MGATGGSDLVSTLIMGITRFTILIIGFTKFFCRVAQCSGILALYPDIPQSSASLVAKLSHTHKCICVYIYMWITEAGVSHSQCC